MENERLRARITEETGKEQTTFVETTNPKVVPANGGPAKLWLNNYAYTELTADNIRKLKEQLLFNS